jgi:TRAP transporter TAXI family solute receptor
MGDKTIPVLPANAWDEPNFTTEYSEMPPQAVPDISGTTLSNLISAWNGTGAYSQDHKKRQNYRVIAAVQQPNYLAIAVNKKSGITDLAQIKTRTQPTWIAGNNNGVLEFYSITEELLKSRGGGFIRTTDRLKRASADVFIGSAQLVNTPEQRMWYEVSQLNDLQFLDIPSALIEKQLEQPDSHRGTMPLAFLRGVDRPIATVVRPVHVIYVRDDAPDQFAYDVARALDEHQDLFRLSGDPYYYDIRLVAVSSPIPMHPGALKYYRERGYIK